MEEREEVQISASAKLNKGASKENNNNNKKKKKAREKETSPPSPSSSPSFLPLLTTFTSETAEGPTSKGSEEGAGV